MRPIHPVTLPPQLVGQPNGRLPSNLLFPIGPARYGHRLEAYTCWYYTILQQECYKADLVLTFTDTYRTYDQQVDLYKRKPATSAKPGTSNHGLGLAIDMAKDGYGNAAKGLTNRDTDIVEWVNAAHDLGFSWERQDEPWHIRHYRPS